MELILFNAFLGGKAKSGEKKSRSTRAGLQFPVGRLHRLLKKGHYAERIGGGAPGLFLMIVFDKNAWEFSLNLNDFYNNKINGGLNNEFVE